MYVSANEMSVFVGGLSNLTKPSEDFVDYLQ